jgi:hypothetical protein
MDRASSRNVEERNACMLLAGKSEGKRPLGKPRRRWVDNMKMYLGWDGVVYWIGWLRRALVNTVLNFLVS